jgi:orotidine-5'-phosphate decarboxylase
MSPLILGIDPNLEILPAQTWQELDQKEYSSVQQKLEFFCQTCLQAAQNLLIGVKFQSAYFEKYGLVGLKVLSESLKSAKKMGLVTILDAKRGDIDRTSDAYAAAYLDNDQDFSADFLTVSPFLGIQKSLEPFLQKAVQNNKGVFVLVRTSNPDAEILQDFENQNNQNLSQFIATEIQKINQKALEDGYFNQVLGKGFGPIGAVVGATKPKLGAELRKLMPNSWFLCPGLGTQGGSFGDIDNFYSNSQNGAWFPMSSGLTNLTELELRQNGLLEGITNRIKKYLSQFN